MAKDKKIDWVQVIIGLVFTALAVFGFSSYMKYKKEEQRRIEAQNEIARQSKVIQESSDTWSRLAQQKEDVIKILEKDNKEMADLLEERKEQIITLSTAVMKFKSIKVVVASPEQTEEGGRTRVSFDQTVDPINVKGYTLTNPAEAELDVNFVRPLKLKTVVTQKPDGSWNTYISGDWPNLTIEQIESFVDPLPLQPKTFGDRIIMGIGVGPSISFDSAFFDVYMLYDFDYLSVGPFVATGSDYGAVGIKFQITPFK